MLKDYFSYGKCILAGEFGYLYGTEAFVVPVKKATLKLSIIPNTKYQCFLNSSPLSDDQNSIFKSILELYKIESGQTFIMNNTIPISMGLGSSAALCNVLAQASLEKPTELQELAKLVHLGENIIHGKSSGIDSYTVVYNHNIHFKNTLDDLNFFDLDFLINNNYSLVLFPTSETHNCKDQIQKVNLLRQINCQEYLNIFEKLKSQCTNIGKAIKDKDAISLGEIFNLIHQLLNKLGVSNQEVEEKILFLNSQGSLGTKITGAGGGGYLLCLCKKNIKAELISSFKNKFLTNKDSFYSIIEVL